MQNLSLPGPLQRQFQTLRSTEERQAFLLAVERKRQGERFISYWEPTKPQQEALKQFTDDIKIFGILGGNRSGKTELGAFIAVAWALGKQFFRDEPAYQWVEKLPIPEKPVTVWLVGLDFRVLKNIIWREKLRNGKNHAPFLPKDSTVVRKVSDVDFEVHFENGSTLHGMSADSGREKFQGASVDLVWIDEECEADIYEECYQRTVDCRGKILLTMTPLADIGSGVRRPWVYDLYNSTGKDVRFTKISVLDNPYVPEEEKVKLKSFWAGSPEEGARLYGDFVQRTGLVYKMWKRQTHMVPPRRISEDTYRVACIDPAPSGPTACVWTTVDPMGNMLVYDTYKKEGMTVSEHAKNILAQNGGAPVDLWLIDPRGGNQRNAETHRTPADIYRSCGIPVRFPNLDEDFGRDALREYLNATVEWKAGGELARPRHPYMEVFDDLRDFEHEISRYVWAYFARGEQKGMVKEKPQKGNDDILNCIQYIAGHMNGRKPRLKGYYATATREEKEKFASLNSY